MFAHPTKVLTVDPERCVLCARCLVVSQCRPMAALRLEWDEPPVIDPARCKHCMACVDRCPVRAVVWK